MTATTSKFWRGMLALSLALCLAHPAQAGDDEDKDGRKDSRHDARHEKITSLNDWRRADRELIEAAAAYLSIDERRHSLMVELGKHRAKHTPGDVSLQSIMARRAISDIFARYDANLGEFRKVQGRAWIVARASYYSRDELSRLLQGRKAEIETSAKSNTLSPQVQYELTRVNLWLKAIENAGNEGPHQIVRGVIGPELGFVLLFSHSSVWRPDQNNRGGGDRSGPRTGDRGNSRGNDSGHDKGSFTPEARREYLRERYEELQKSNERAQARIEDRSREMERITQYLEKLDSEAKAGVKPVEPDAEKK